MNQQLYWVALAGRQIDAMLNLSIPEVEIVVDWQAMIRFLRGGGGVVNCGGRVGGR